MTEQLKLFVDPLHVESCILTLRRLNGVNVQLETKELSAPEPKEHGQYSLEFAALAPIIISVTGMVTSLTALATALVQLKIQMRVRKDNDSKPMVIIVRDERVEIAESSTADEVESQLRNVIAVDTEGGTDSSAGDA